MPRGTLKSSILLAGTLGVPQVAQPSHAREAPACLGQVSPDSAVLNSAQAYLNAWGRGDAEEMVRCLHPDLAASILELAAPQGSLLKTLARIQGVQVGLGPATGCEQLNWQIEVLGVRGHSASVRAQGGPWSAFIHLGASSGGWSVIHVLWEHLTGPAA